VSRGSYRGDLDHLGGGGFQGRGSFLFEKGRIRAYGKRGGLEEEDGGKLEGTVRTSGEGDSSRGEERKM